MNACTGLRTEPREFSRSQVDTDVPWRERFAWTFDVAAAAGPPPEQRPSTASYLSASACFGGATWGTAPSSSTARSAA